MGKLIFLIGAARSGKSRLAVKMAEELGGRDVTFIATCVPRDDEMRRRVALHKKSRPSSWTTVEGKMGSLKELKKIKSPFKVVILDCLTLFVSGLLVRGLREGAIKRKVREAAEAMSKAPYTTIVVSNEVGAGVVPAEAIAREFRDLSGLANQIIAQYASEVYLVVSGIAVKIK